MQFLFVGSAQVEVASYARTTSFTPGGICIAIDVHYLAATTVRCDIKIVHCDSFALVFTFEACLL